MTEATETASEPKKKSKSNAKKASATASAAGYAFEVPAPVASIITELAKSNFEQSVETTKALLKSNDVKTAVELQQDLISATFQRNLEAVREINELAVSSMRDSFAPYSEKFTEAFSKFRFA